MERWDERGASRRAWAVRRRSGRCWAGLLLQQVLLKSYSPQFSGHLLAWLICCEGECFDFPSHTIRLLVLIGSLLGLGRKVNY